VDSTIVVIPSKQNSPGHSFAITCLCEQFEGASDKQFVVIPLLAPDKTSLGEEVSRRQRGRCWSRSCRPDQYLKVHSVRDRIGQVPSLGQIIGQLDDTDACHANGAEYSFDVIESGRPVIPQK
jgi:hypothetical protein